MPTLQELLDANPELGAAYSRNPEKLRTSLARRGLISEPSQPPTAGGFASRALSALAKFRKPTPVAPADSLTDEAARLRDSSPVGSVGAPGGVALGVKPAANTGSQAHWEDYVKSLPGQVGGAGAQLVGGPLAAVADVPAAIRNDPVGGQNLPSKAGRALYKLGEKMLEESRPTGTPGIFGESMLSAQQSFPYSLPALLGMPGATAAMAAAASGRKYLELSDKMKAPPREALIKSMPEGIIEYLTERGATKALQATGLPFIERAKQFVAAEVPGELMATPGQDLFDTLFGLNDTVDAQGNAHVPTMGEWAASLPRKEAVTALSTIISGAPTVGGAQLVDTGRQALRETFAPKAQPTVSRETPPATPAQPTQVTPTTGGDLNGGQELQGEGNQAGQVTRMSSAAPRPAEQVEAELKQRQLRHPTKEAYYEEAKRFHYRLQEDVAGIANDIGAQQQLRPGGEPKDRAGTFEKIKRKGYPDHSGLTDVAATMIVLDTPAQMEQALQKLREKYGEIAEPGLKRTGLGYVDQKVLVSDPESGVIGEIILVPRPFFSARNEQGGHDLYDMIEKHAGNTQSDVALANQLTEMSKRLYSLAERDSMKDWGDYLPSMPANVSTDTTSAVPSSMSFINSFDATGTQEAPLSLDTAATEPPPALSAMNAGRRSQLYSNTAGADFTTSGTGRSATALPGISSGIGTSSPGSVANPSYRQVMDTLGARPLEEGVAEATRGWESPPKIQIVETAEQVPVNHETLTSAPSGTKAAVTGDTMYLVRSQIKSWDDLVTALSHEQVGHIGTRAVLGEKFDGFLDRMWQSRQKLDRSILETVARNYPHADPATVEGQRELMDEYLAHLAQTNPKASMVQMVVGAVRRWLSKYFPKLKVSDAEIVSLIAKSRRAVTGSTARVGETRLRRIKPVEEIKNRTFKEMADRIDIPKAASPNITKTIAGQDFQSLQDGDGPGFLPVKKYGAEKVNVMLRRAMAEAVAEANLKPELADKIKVPGAVTLDGAMKLSNRARYWYELSSTGFREMVSAPAAVVEKLIDVVAATSGGKEPKQNLRDAVAVLSQHMRGEPVTVGQRDPASITSALSDKPIESHKFGNFSQTMQATSGLRDGVPLPTIDLQMAKWFGMQPEEVHSNPVMYETLARFVMKVRDMQNELLPKGEQPYESWQVQALAWVQQRGTSDPDDYAMHMPGMIADLQKAGVPVKDGKLTVEALMDPRTSEVLAPTSKSVGRARTATLETRTKLTESGARAADVYDSLAGRNEPWARKARAEYEAIQRRTMRALGNKRDTGKKTRGPSVLSDLFSAIVGKRGEVTRIDTNGFGTFEAEASPNMRIPLVATGSGNQKIALSDEQRAYLLAVLGKDLKQAASAASQFDTVELGQHDTFSLLVRRYDNEDISPADLENLERKIGRPLNYSKAPNGWLIDINIGGYDPLTDVNVVQSAASEVFPEGDVIAIPRKYDSDFIEEAGYDEAIRRFEEGLVSSGDPAGGAGAGRAELRARALAEARQELQRIAKEQDDAFARWADEVGSRSTGQKTRFSVGDGKEMSPEWRAAIEAWNSAQHTDNEQLIVDVPPKYKAAADRLTKRFADRIRTLDYDEHGWWVLLKKGWTNEEGELHQLHEETLGALTKALAASVKDTRFLNEPTEAPSRLGELQQRNALITGDQRIEQERRGVITWKETAALAKALGTSKKEVAKFLERQRGTAFNAEQLQQAANMIGRREAEMRRHFADLQKKVEDGTITDENLAEAREMMMDMVDMSAQYMGVRAEAGRALQYFRKLKKTTQRAEAYRQIIQQAGGRKTVLAEIVALSTATQPGQVNRMVRKFTEASTMDKVIYAWRAGLLTGIQTHVVNVLSNQSVSLFEDAATGLAAAIGKLHGGEKVGLREAYSRFHGNIIGTMTGLSAAAKVIRTGEDIGTWSKAEDPTRGNPFRNAQGELTGLNKLSIAPEMVYRMLGGMDAYFKTVEMAKQIEMWAMDEHIKTGRPLDELRATVPQEIVERAEKMAERQTFQDAPGKLTADFMTFLRRHPSLKFIVPFVNTPTNLLKYALRTNAFTGWWFDEVRDDLKAGGKRRDLAIARMTLGTSIMVTGYMLAAAGIITGGPPEDKNERDWWYRSGRQGYSIKIGDKWYAYNRFDPLMLPFGIAADVHRLREGLGEKDAKKLFMIGWRSLLTNLANKTYLSGLSEFVQMINEPERYGEEWFKSLAGSFVPTIFSHIAQANDDYIRRADTIMDSVKKRIPGKADELPPRLDVAGQPIKKDAGAGFWYKLLSPVRVSKDRNDPVAEEMIRLGVYPGSPSRSLSKGKKRIKLTAEEHNQLIAEQQPQTYVDLYQLIRSGRYQRLDDDEKIIAISRVAGAGSRRTKPLREQLKSKHLEN